VKYRVGLGFDVHPFGDAPPLVLGGVQIPDAPRLAGHSDGDAIAHAVADALLGREQRAEDDTFKDADSMGFLAEIAERIRLAGWWVENVDVAVVAETPRLAPYIEAMAANLVEVLAPARQPMGQGIGAAVRPKRAEGLGAIGRAEGIAVWTVALLVRG
jgi:2-C-methyl-D-erythritol 2,4-cyclodiphosphate synthase